MPFPLRRVLDPLVEPVSLTDMKNYLRVDDFMTADDDLISTIISTARERAEDLTARCLFSQQWIFSMDRFPTWWGDRTGSEYFFNTYHPRHHSMFRSDNLSIILPRGPVLSVDSIVYKDLSGTLVTLDPSTYTVDLISEPARIHPAYSGSWPVSLWDLNSVTVNFTCGYEQTATETVILGEDLTAAVTRQLKALSLTSAKVAGTAVVATMTAGIVSVPGGTAGQSVQVVYQINSIPLSFVQAIKLISAAYYENRSDVVQGSGNFNKFPTPLSAESLLSTYEMFHFGFPKG